MENQINIQDQVESALSNERRSKNRQDSKRALFAAFVIIPSVVVLAVVAWVVVRVASGG